MSDLAIKILPGIATALLAAYLTSRWALGRLLADKWWDRKERAYTEIIDALYDMVQYTEIKKEDYGDGGQWSEERMNELQAKYSDATWKIRRATSIGAFVISDSAAEVLEKLKDQPKMEWDEGPPWEVYEAEYLAHKEALEAFRKAARVDLRGGQI